ncbi:RNA pyrophosphohydrolase [Alkalilimnicola sp. S0819]|uniref:RNA pyrophosphohydrolase n=1 Tax=Alkalilimnicola sp. S0819 TaxID=2613922 RepID=UPI0012628D21|nr:RNA pyrophosphohydrolase [Alkalilimnicola sp. S0819]KAB7623035.1 RNA pyrophosphohydrolase [Alkalilimnicola sp. S0819]MPQ17148.1 RNA pyrophosphohydrolase [Alkalilimnicola sp. S0819]
MIDSDGFRPNVGIIITDGRSRVFWARRLGQDAWQFPQGGIKREESPEEALYRELHEEVGLGPEHVEIMGCTRSWLRYRLPEHLIRHHRKPLCIGQKQVWFMLRLLAEETVVDFRRTGHPEFDHWRWVDYWRPLREVVFFKRRVYDQALSELAPLLFPTGAPSRPPRRGRHPHRLRRERS